MLTRCPHTRPLTMFERARYDANAGRTRRDQRSGARSGARARRPSAPIGNVWRSANATTPSAKATRIVAVYESVRSISHPAVGGPIRPPRPGRRVEDPEDRAEPGHPEVVADHDRPECDEPAVADAEHEHEHDHQRVRRPGDRPCQEADGMEREAGAVEAERTEPADERTEPDPGEDTGSAEDPDQHRGRDRIDVAVLGVLTDEHERHEQAEPERRRPTGGAAGTPAMRARRRNATVADQPARVDGRRAGCTAAGSAPRRWRRRRTCRASRGVRSTPPPAATAPMSRRRCRRRRARRRAPACGRTSRRRGRPSARIRTRRRCRPRRRT